MWILSILAFLVIFSILVLVHEWGHYKAALWAGVRPEEFAIGFGKQIYSWRRGETLFRLNLIPLGGYVKMTGEAENSEDPRAFGNVPVYKRLVIALAGVVMNWILAGVVLGTLFLVGTEPIMISETDFRQQLEAGNIEYVYEEGSDTPVDFIIKEVKYSLPGAIGKGFTETWRLTKAITEKVAEIPGQIIATKELPEDLSGPVGIAQLTHQITPKGLKALAKFMALLSISLAVMNLLPIPALDGGMVLFLFYEGITGRKPSETVQIILTYVGISLLLLFFVAITWRDILRLFPGYS